MALQDSIKPKGPSIFSKSHSSSSISSSLASFGPLSSDGDDDEVPAATQKPTIELLKKSEPYELSFGTNKREKQEPYAFGETTAAPAKHPTSVHRNSFSGNTVESIAQTLGLRDEIQKLQTDMKNLKMQRETQDFVAKELKEKISTLEASIDEKNSKLSVLMSQVFVQKEKIAQSDESVISAGKEKETLMEQSSKKLEVLKNDYEASIQVLKGEVQLNYCILATSLTTNDI